MALGRHREKKTMSWHGFHLAPEEERAVVATAFSTFQGDAANSSLDLEVLRGVTVYADNASGDMR